MAFIGRERSFRQKIGAAILSNTSFRFFRQFGVHVSRVHFYQPIPDIRELDRRGHDWTRPSEMPGVAMREADQITLMRDVFAPYVPECDFPRTPTAVTYQYHSDNIYFGYASAVAMHSLIRHNQPRRVVEIGAGNSTLVIANAARLNAAEGHATEVIAIDPYPSDVLRAGVPGVSVVLPKAAQDVNLDVLTSLGPGDILSIDSSHAVKTGGDVTYLYLEVLPRLAPGVLVHIHDIFLPFDYPEKWVRNRIFWTEQYLVQAFLVCNSCFDVLWAQRYCETTYPAEYARAFGNRTGEDENHGSYSLWLRRTGTD